MSRDSPSKSSESVDAILKQIKEFTENDTFSTSSTPLEDPKGLIEDITITSSVSENNALSNDFSNDDLKISSEEIDPDLQYYLSKMSKISGHDVDSLSDAAREFQSMKFDSDSNNEEMQIDANEYLNLFNDRLNVETSSLDDVMNMVEIMQNEKAQGNFFQPSIDNQIDYFPNDEDIYIGKNDFLSDDFSLNERERKINEIIAKQNQRNKSSLRKSQQKLLSKPTFSTSTDQSLQTTSDSNKKNDIGSSSSLKFNNQQNSNLHTQNIENINKPKNDPTPKIDQSPQIAPTVANDDLIFEEEEEEKDDENEILSVKQIQNNSFSTSTTNTNTNAITQTKPSSKSSSFTQTTTEPTQTTTISNSPTVSIPVSTPESYSNKSNSSQASIQNKQNQNLSKRPIQNQESRRNNEEETEEDIFSFSSKERTNSNDNDLDEEIKKNNHSISQLMTSSSKQSSNKNSNSFRSNKDRDDVVDIIKNVNEELERNKIDQNNSEAFEIEDEKSPQINNNYKSNLHKSFQNNIASTNTNLNEPNSNSYSYSPHISNHSKKGKTSKNNSNSLNNIFSDSTNQNNDKNIENNNNNGSRSELFLNNNDLNIDDSNNSEDLNIFDFDDNSNNNKSYTGQHVSTKLNPRPAASSSSFLRDSQKSRNSKKQQMYNNSDSSSQRRQQLTEADLKNAELTATNRKLREENELLKQKISELETENEQLKYSSITSNERASSLEHENEKLSSQLSLQSSQFENLKTSKENAQKAYTEIEAFLNNQTTEAQKLANQRDQLIEMLQKQNTICQKYEQLFDSAKRINNSAIQNGEMASSTSSSLLPNQQNTVFFNNNNANSNSTTSSTNQQNQNQQIFTPQNNFSYQNIDPNQSFSQNQSFSSTQSQPQNYNPNPNYNQNQSFSSNQSFSQNQNYNPNPNQNYNQNQSFSSNPNYNPNQNYNQNQNQSFNQSFNHLAYKNELIAAKVPDFNDLLSQIYQIVADIFGIDKESSNNNSSSSTSASDDDSENSLNSVLKEVVQLKDSSNIPPNSRIANIVSYLSCRVKDDKESLESSKTKRAVLRAKLESSQSRELQVLQILEGELRFLQHLAHSADIQSVVFYRPSLGKSLSLNKEAQSELMRHCVSVQKFIDDTIGFYSKDQLTSLANGIFSTDNRNNGKFKKSGEAEKNSIERIFNLFHTDDFEKGINYMLSFLSSRILNDPDANNSSFLEKQKKQSNSDFGDTMNYRQVADLFFAQSIMNEILQNHVIDLQSQVVYANHQNQKLQIELRDQEDTKAQLEYATKELHHLQRKDEKLLKLISRAIEIPQQVIEDESKEQPSKSGRKRSSSVNNKNSSESASVSESNYDYVSDSGVPPKKRSKGRSSSVQQESKTSKKRAKKGAEPTGKDIIETMNAFVKKYCEINDRLIEKEKQMKTVVHEVEKVQKNYKKKNEKRRQIIRDLKKVITSQTGEIEALKKETENAQKKCTIETKQKEVKLGSLKIVLQGILKLRDELKGMIIKIYKEHKNQIQHLRNDWNNMITNYEHSYESSSRSQSSLSLLEQERNVLRNRIVSDQRSFKKTINALQKKAQTFRQQYEALSADVQSLRAENERLSSEYQNAMAGLEHAKTQLDAVKTEKKALEVKMKAGEERFDCERKTLQSQLAAKVMSMQADVSSQLKNEQENRMKEIHQIVSLASPFLNIKNGMNENMFNSPLSVVKALCTILSEVIESHKKSVTEASDASSARALLSLSPGSPLCPAISNILRELREIRNKLEKVKKGEKETSFQLEQLERNIASSNQMPSSTSSSFEWENWARRVLGGVSEINVASLSVENLRKSIEEAVLASVSQRRLIFMLRSLREEKKALLKFDRSILNSGSSISLSSPAWGAVVAVYASIRRMQQLAGCMPMQVRNVQQSGRIAILDEDIRIKKKRSKKESRRGRRNDDDVDDDNYDEFADDYENGKNGHSGSKKRNSKNINGKRRRRNNGFEFENDDVDDNASARNRNRKRSKITSVNNYDEYDNNYDDESDDDYNQKKFRKKYK